MRKIFTHFNLDLDACAAVWAVRTFVRGFADAVVEFVPASWRGEELTEGDIAVDLDCGIKGERDSDGIVHSAFELILNRYAPAEDVIALAEVGRFIDAQDAHGNPYTHLAPEMNSLAQATFARTGLNAVLRALQAAHPRNDALVLERMGEIFDGLLKAGRSRLRAEAEADQAELLGEGQVAICRNNRYFATNGTLFGRGVRVIVYVDGYNLGVIRHSDEPLRMDADELRAVVDAAGETDEWFAHSAGFLFCRGSRKNPATSPSSVDPRDLAEAALRALGE